MPPLFYKRHWHIIGPSITKVLLLALNLGQNLKDLNHTFITLIPKKKQPQTIVDYHLISLCNVLYKIVSKTIANRLKAALPSLISKSQSAFIPGRQIIDNILVAYEVFQFLKRKKNGKHDFMSLKLDMSKAYDRVE